MKNSPVFQQHGAQRQSQTIPPLAGSAPGFFDVIEPESREDMLNHLVSQANSGAPAVAVAGGDGTLGIAARGSLQYGNGAGPLPCGYHECFFTGNRNPPDFDHALHILNTGVPKMWTCSHSTGKFFSKWRALARMPEL